jgi:hypothetical protein
LSLSYCRKVLAVLNKWGAFFCLKEEESGPPFQQVPFPNAYEAGILQAAFSSNGSKRKESEPLDPRRLEAVASRFAPEQYRWLHVSVWFGLRPGEVDNLGTRDSGGSPKFWRIETHASGREVLCVYQPKLVALEKSKRWKKIPVLYREQEVALEVIRSGQALKRPLAKTVEKHVGPGTRLYGGRKAFTDLMLDRGQHLENIFAWLGHQSIDTLWKHYRNRSWVHFDEVQKVPSPAA